MELTQLLLSLVDNPHYKTIVEIGAHDDTRTLKLAQHFKHVSCYYEYLKIPDRSEGNIDIQRMPYPDVLADLHRFDVVLIDNEFHHFPDVWQMWTFERLGRYQELFIVEWDMTGNLNGLYSAFQNCAPLCMLTRDIMSRSVSDGRIEIEQTVKGRYAAEFQNRQSVIDYFKYILPDHFTFGEKELLRRLAGVQFPLELWEGFDLFKIRRAQPNY